LALRNSQLLELAKRGAAQRYQELQDELAALVRMFPSLRGTTSRQVSPSSAGPQAAGMPVRRRKSTWSAAQRQAVSVRMKKYWAARRKANR
jgi:hypothetical protein